MPVAAIAPLTVTPQMWALFAAIVVVALLIVSVLPLRFDPNNRPRKLPGWVGAQAVVASATFRWLAAHAAGVRIAGFSPASSWGTIAFR